jgi:hypothetical protein
MHPETPEIALWRNLLHTSQKQRKLFFSLSIINRETVTGILRKHLGLAHTLWFKMMTGHTAHPHHSMGQPPCSQWSLVSNQTLLMHIMEEQYVNTSHHKKLHNIIKSYKKKKEKIIHTWIYLVYLNQYEVHW